MKELLDKYSVSRAELINAVRGKSKDPITQLVNRPGSLDVDRWSYTICDAQTLGVFPGRFAGNYVNDPFKNIALYDGEIVFLDLDSVANCLELRVNMFEKFYKSPELRAKEAFSGKVAKELLDRGVITRESIFKIGDIDFDKLVREYGGELGKRLYSLDGFDSYGPVNASEKELENFLGQITDHPFVVKRHKAFDAGIETPVMIDGTIKTYKEWNYRHAIQLKHRMSEWSHNTHVYGYENDSVLKDAVDKALREFGIDLSARLEYFMDWEHLDSD